MVSNLQMSAQRSIADVINIRKGGEDMSKSSMSQQIFVGLSGKNAVHLISAEDRSHLIYKKSLPTMVLYEDQGIELYDAITRDSNYYLYREELSIIERYGQAIALAIRSAPFVNARVAKVEPNTLTGSSARSAPTQAIAPSERSSAHDDQSASHVLLLDLGAGRLDKASCLLNHVASVMGQYASNVKASATYCAVDLQYADLVHRLSTLAQSNQSFHVGRHTEDAIRRNATIAVRGVCGSYLETLNLLEDDTLLHDTIPFDSETTSTAHTKCLLWLGSSLSNVTPPEAAKFLRKFTNEAILGPGDTLLVGLDRCRDSKRVKTAYGEKSATWQRYLKNGIKNSGLILGGEAAQHLDGGKDWEYVAHWDPKEGRHMRFMRSVKDLSFDVKTWDDNPPRKIQSIQIESNELILMSQSYKYTNEEILRLFQEAGLERSDEWTNESNDCSVYLLRRLQK